MRLFIAEKPSLAKVIASGLGGGKQGNGVIDCGEDIVTWCFGHLYELAEPEEYNPEWKKWEFEQLPMIPGTWQKVAKKEAKKQLAIIKKQLKKASEVVNAGDPDREGQLLVDEVLTEMAWAGKTSRIWLDALDDGSVQKALNTIRPNSDFKGLLDSAEARGFADWTVGLNLTRAYTIKGREAGYDGVLSIGRVQTPTLALVVNRDKEIDNFKPIPYFDIQGQFKITGGLYHGKWQPTEDDKDTNGYVTEKAKAEAVCKAIDHKIGTIEEHKATKKKLLPELPFSLSALQSYANKKWGYGAKQTLDIAQSLYEKHKATTYPRSDCRFLSEGQHGEVQETMESLSIVDPLMKSFIDKCDLSAKTKMFNDKKISAHTAIVPTMAPPAAGAMIAKMTTEELNVYDAIRRRYISQFLPAHEFESIKILTRCEGHLFKTTGKVILNVGWKIIEGTDEKPEKSLPDIGDNKTAMCERGDIEAKKTKPASRFTEGTLIEAMAGIAKFVTDPKLKKRLKESAGIGTEATRGQIIESLKNRKFFSAKGKKVISTDTARELIGLLPESLTSANTTAMWEMGLEAIRENKVSLDDFLAKQNTWVEKEVERAKGADLKGLANLPHCPKCKKGVLRRIKGKKGFFHGCSNHPDCSTSFPDKKGKPDFKAKKSGKKSSFKKKR